MTIDHVDLARVDLNLLVALDALLAERSVTRAAARIGLGQSAMSSTLARLRRLFDDELLTRSPEGMRPTPRALALAEPLRTALRQVQALVRREEAFDPATVERRFTISLPDSTEVLLGPRLLAYLRAEAPGVQLLLRAFDRATMLEDLDTDRAGLEGCRRPQVRAPRSPAAARLRRTRSSGTSAGSGSTKRSPVIRS